MAIPLPIRLTVASGGGGALNAPGNIVVTPDDLDFDVTFDAVVDAVGYRWRIDGGAWTSIGATSFSGTTTAGGHTIEVQALGAGETGTSDSFEAVEPDEATPMDFSPALWWDADQETALDGAAIQPSDFSGNGRHGVNAGGTVAVLKHAIVNGKKTFRLNTTNYFTLAASLNDVADCTFIVVTKHASSAIVAYAYDDVAGDFIGLLRDNDPPVVRFHITTGGALESYGKGLVSSSSWGCYTFAKTNTTCVHYFNGVPMPRYGDLTATGSTTMDFKTLLGGLGTTLTADVAEVIIIEDALSPEDIWTLHEEYINPKYALEPKSIFVALGNSLTAGGVQTKDLIALNRDDLDVYVFGHSGDNLTAMIAYYPTEVAPLFDDRRPHNIFSLYEFTNTSIAADNGAAALAQYYGLCADAKAAGWENLGAEPVPFYSATQPGSNNARLTIVADIRANFVPTYGVGVIQYTDLTAFDAYADISNGTYYSDAPNGVHPTATGYTDLSEVATAKVEAILDA